jgi:CheY-like chemotaxis protein
MRQILLNVGVNAKDALPRGGRITFETRVAHLDERFVRSSPDLAAGDYVEVVVGDTGVGMPSEVVEHAFEPFFTTKTDGRGTGLGLSVVYGIVKNHHGHVTITSKPMIGTTIRIYLPSAGRSSTRPRPPRRHAAVALPLPPAPLASGPAPSPPPVPSPAAGGNPPQAPATRAPVYEVPPLDDLPTRSETPAPVTVLSGPAHAAAQPPAAAPPAPPGSVPTPPGPSGLAAAPAARPGPAAPAERPSPETPPPAPKPGPTRRVLVVDDEPAIREMARDILQGRGYEVIPARDGVEALDLYRQQWGRIDLVVLDMVMPRLGGLETFRRLLGMDRGVRVVLCSGHADTTKAKQAIKEGALGFFAKPFTMTELLAWVEKILRRDGHATQRPS